MAKSQGMSDELVKMLADADKRKGFPPGTMYSIVKQETGGNDKYLNDPSAYHYAANAEGKRIAGHTGKVSTAFGPFGILESTGADPGYGVAPLKDKSLAEQVRFSSDYLGARSKSAGSLHAGMAGYGEGTKYADQVANRRDRTSMPIPTPVPVVAADAPIVMAPPVVAAAPVSAPIVEPEQVAQGQSAIIPVAEPDPWAAFQTQVQQRAPVQTADLGFGQPMPAGVVVPDFMKTVDPVAQTPEQFAWAKAPKTGSKYSTLLKQLIG